MTQGVGFFHHSKAIPIVFVLNNMIIITISLPSPSPGLGNNHFTSFVHAWAKGKAAGDTEPKPFNRSSKPDSEAQGP